MKNIFFALSLALAFVLGTTHVSAQEAESFTAVECTVSVDAVTVDAVADQAVAIDAAGYVHEDATIAHAATSAPASTVLTGADVLQQAEGGCIADEGMPSSPLRMRPKQLIARDAPCGYCCR